MCSHPTYTCNSFTIHGNTSTFYDKPIAVFLEGPVGSLACICCWCSIADAIDLSGMMDDRSARAQLVAHREELIDAKLAQDKGRLVKLATFGSRDALAMSQI